MDIKEILQKENELKDELAKLQKLKSKVTDSNIDWDKLNEINERLSEYGVTSAINIRGVRQQFPKIKKNSELFPNFLYLLTSF